MHILLTDVLTCPRCGPRFGLIVLADEMVDRQVVTGSLGCANCRNTYPITDRVVDLTLRGAESDARLEHLDAERAFRLAALTGVANRPASLVIAGADADAVAEVARLLPAAQVVGLSKAPPGVPLPGGISWLVGSGPLPVREGALLAVAVVGSRTGLRPTDLAGGLAVQGRLVVDAAGPELVANLRSTGWTLHLEQDGVAVASRPERG